MTNFLLKIRFIESECHSFLQRNNVLNQDIETMKSSSSINESFHLRTKMLNEILDKCKPYGDKRDLG